MKRVAIVGAGIVGLFCALRLAQAGARVTLLEAEGPDYSNKGPAASLAAAGMLAPIGEGDGPLLDRVALQSFDLWRRLSKDALWEDGVRFDGGVILAPDPHIATEMQRHARELGRSAEPLNHAQWRKRTGFETRVEHAVFVEDEGVADPERVLSGLAMDARRHGVLMMFGQDVASVTANTVTTHADDVIEADHVLLAPGPWATEKLMAAAPALKHIRPAKGHLVSVQLGRQLDANVRAESFYLTRRRDDVVLGATMEFDTWSRAVNRERVAELLAAAEAVLPGEVRDTGTAWAGIRPMSPDGAPMIGWSNDILIAAGHSRNGWLLAPITAEIITAHVLGAPVAPEWAALSPERFA